MAAGFGPIFGGRRPADIAREVFGRPRRHHRWFYVPEMRPDEAILIKCYDSAPDKARFTAHSAFEDPTAPADVLPRESIELRTLAFHV